MSTRRSRGAGAALVAGSAALVALVALVALGAAACVDVPTDATAVGSIAFDSLPFPSIVGGESMRDSTGAVAPFRARVYNTQGELIPDAEVEYLSPDTLATISDAGVLTVRALRSTPVRVFAAVGSLQSEAREVPIVPRPDTVRRTGTTDTLRFDAVATARFSDTLSVSVLSRGESGFVPVPNWLVSYRVQHDGRDIPPGDTSLTHVVDTQGRPSFVDTTDASGRSDRQLRVRRAGLASPLDSLIVFATARYHGQPIEGAPVRLVLYVTQP